MSIGRRAAHRHLDDVRYPHSRSRSRLGGNAELAAFGDFLNLFNSDANESVLDRRLGNVNYLVPSRFIAPRRLMLGAKFRF